MKNTMYERLVRRLFVFAIVAMIILSMLFTALMVWGNYTQGKNYSDDAAVQISGMIDDYFERLNSMCIAYLSTRDLSLYLNRRSLSDYMSQSAVNALKETISIFLMFQPGMEMCVMSDDEITEIRSMSGIGNLNFVPSEDPLFRALEQSEDKYAICLNYNPPYMENVAMHYVSVIYKITKVNDQSTTAGYLSLDLNARLFTAMIRRMVSSDYDCRVVYPDGSIAYASNYEESDGFDSQYISPLTGIAVSVRNRSQVWWPQFALVIIVLLIMVFLFEVILLYMLREGSLKIINPIYRLIGTMQRVCADNNLNVYLEYDGDSPEIREMYRSFNELVSSLSTYVRENQTKELLLVKARLDSLVEKINPHFLYNVLETISAQALVDSSPAASRMCQKLGSMFRYNLRPDESVSLKRELEAVENYIQLHNISFARSTCVYEIDVPEEFIELQIPKLVLQPIVENAFKHGFDNRPGESRLRIDLRCEERRLLLRIQDNGRGMSEADMESLRERMRAAESLAPHDTDTGYGIRYTHVRLKLFFGEEYETRIFSSDGAGLTVCLCIPEHVQITEGRSSDDTVGHH